MRIRRRSTVLIGVAAAAPNLLAVLLLFGCCGFEIDPSRDSLSALCDTAVRALDHSAHEGDHHPATPPEAERSLPSSRAGGEKDQAPSWSLQTHSVVSELSTPAGRNRSGSFSRPSSSVTPRLESSPPDLLSFHQTLLI